IEAETAATISRTQIIPATARYLTLLSEAKADQLELEVRELFDELVAATRALEEVNQYPGGIDAEGLDLAIYARDRQLVALEGVREPADKLERIVADDLWPLPKYSEMLFIK